VKGVLIAGLVGIAGAVFANRDDFIRYLRIRRMGQNPALVGASITTQGNKLALRKTPAQRIWDREHTGL